jgi:hypothetical protein
MSSALLHLRAPTADAATDVGHTPHSRLTLREHILPCLVLMIAVTAVVYPFWPGRMNADTLQEIAQAKGGWYTHQYSPILQAIWHPFINAGFGPQWVFTGQVILFVLSSYFLLRLAYQPLGAAIATALITISPVTYGGLALIGRDTWFLALLLASFVAVSRAFASGGRGRSAWIGMTLVLAWFTVAARENAGASTFIPLALVAALILVQRRPDLLQHRLKLATLAVAIGLAATVAMMASQAVIVRALKPVPLSVTAPLFIYDLAALSRVDSKNYFPASVLHDRSMRTIDALTSVDSMNAMISGPSAPIAWPVVGKVASALQTAWEHQILAEPLAYVAERFRMMLDEVGLTNRSIWIYHPYIDPNNFGYHTTFPGADNIANRYMQLFSDAANNGDFLFSAWAYLLFCAAAAAALLASRAWPRFVIGALALSALTYQLGLLAALMGSNYRYEAVAVGIAEITAAAVIGWAWQNRRVALAPRRRFASQAASSGN